MKIHYNRVWMVLGVWMLLMSPGCLAPLWDRGPSSGEHDGCLNYYESTKGSLPGAWANVTAENFSAARSMTIDAPRPGAPVEPQTQEIMGTNGNITSVQWRVDGGAVWEAGRYTYSEGRLASPEFIRISHRVETDGNQSWEMTGLVDHSRPAQNATDLVVSFLDAIRGPQEENTDLASRFLPIADIRNHLPQPISASGEEPTQPPRSIIFPSLPWQGGALLDSTVGNATMESRLGSLQWDDEGWGWTVNIPEGRWTMMGGDQFWQVKVDALDQGEVFYRGEEAMGPKIWNRTRDHFEALGLPSSDFARWETDQQQHWGFYCASGEDERGGS